MPDVINPIYRPPSERNFKPSIDLGDGRFLCEAERLAKTNNFPLRNFGGVMAIDCESAEDATWLFDKSCRVCVNGPRDGGGCQANVLRKFIVPHLDVMREQGRDIEKALQGNSSELEYGGVLGRDLNR
jgi:hypothetical protein